MSTNEDWQGRVAKLEADLASLRNDVARFKIVADIAKIAGPTIVLIFLGWLGFTSASTVPREVTSQLGKSIEAEISKQLPDKVGNAVRDRLDVVLDKEVERQINRDTPRLIDQAVATEIAKTVPGEVRAQLETEGATRALAEINRMKAAAEQAATDAKQAASMAGGAADDAKVKLSAIANGTIDRLQTGRIDVIDADGESKATISASPQQGIVVSGGGIDVQAGDVRTSRRFVVYHPEQKKDRIWIENYGDLGGRLIVHDNVRERLEMRGDNTGSFLNFIDNSDNRNAGVLQRQAGGEVTIYMFTLKDIPKQ
jgi:hypothetical protein